jgi:hypothetical protein
LRVNIFTFVDHLVFVASIQLCHHNGNATTNNLKMSGMALFQ